MDLNILICLFLIASSSSYQKKPNMQCWNTEISACANQKMVTVDVTNVYQNASGTPSGKPQAKWFIVLKCVRISSVSPLLCRQA